MADKPYKVFIIYAREDEHYRNEIVVHLLPMERKGEVSVWTDHQLIAGEEWAPAIKQNLKKADIILLLVSTGYFKSDYIHQVEIKEALERHERGEVKILPVIVRPCDWESDPVLSQMQVLPTNAVPVSDIRYWQRSETAWVDVVKQIQVIIAQIKSERDQIKRKNQEEQKSVQEETRRHLERIEDIAWAQAVQIPSQEAYKTYLNAYPNGRYVRQAKTELHKIYWDTFFSRNKKLLITLWLTSIILIGLIGFIWGSIDEFLTGERKAWEITTKINTSVCYREYLKHYQFRSEAHDSLGKCLRIEEKQAWETIMDMDSIPAYELYLKQYGERGRFSKDARVKIAVKKSEKEWPKVIQENTIAAYYDFLKFAGGEYRPQAVRRLDDLLGPSEKEAWERANKENNCSAYLAFIEKYGPYGRKRHDEAIIKGCKDIDIKLLFE